MFERDALLLVGHGSTRQPAAACPLFAHADVIRQTGQFAETKVGLLRGEPNVVTALHELMSPVVHVVPFFFEQGYFSRIVIPDLLLPACASRVVRFCLPVGCHAGIASLLEARLTRHCDTFGTDPKSLLVLLVGHGSSRGPGRALSLQKHAATLEKTERYGWVRVAYLEEAPLVADAMASARARTFAVIGCFTNAGTHAVVDLPRLITGERAARGASWPPVHDLGTIASDAAMPRIILDQVAAVA